MFEPCLSVTTSPVTPDTMHLVNSVAGRVPSRHSYDAIERSSSVMHTELSMSSLAEDFVRECSATKPQPEEDLASSPLNEPCARLPTAAAGWVSKPILRNTRSKSFVDRATRAMIVAVPRALSFTSATKNVHFGLTEVDDARPALPARPASELSSKAPRAGMARWFSEPTLRNIAASNNSPTSNSARKRTPQACSWVSTPCRVAAFAREGLERALARSLAVIVPPSRAPGKR